MIDNREEFKDIAHTGEQMANVVLDFLIALLKREGYIEDFSSYAIIHHISNGGSTIQTSVSMERVDVMTELLKKHHVSFLCINNTDPLTKEQNYVFVMKDIKSVRNSFDEIQKEFQILLDNEKKEVMPQTFLSLYKNEKVGVIDNLTSEEVLAFREVSKEYEFQYTVATGEKKGTYCIYCSDLKMLKNAMMDVSYYFSGEKGQKYETNLKNYIDNIHAFTERINKVPEGKRLYLVDAKEPRHFVSITNKEFISHSINLEVERMPGGRSREVLADTLYKTYDIRQTDQLLTIAKAMKIPIFLSQQEFPLVSSILKKGEAILSENYMEQMENLKEFLKKSKSVLRKEPIYKNALEYKHMIGYVGIPKNVIQILEQMEMKDIVIVGNDIAFLKERKGEIDAILEPLLFQDLDPLQRKEAELFYNGVGDLVISREPMEPQYILNGSYPNYVLKNSEKGLTVFIDGKQDMFIARDTPDFQTTAISILETIEHPVILSEGEMYSEDRMNYIKSRAYENVVNEALRVFRCQEKLEKKELHSYNGQNDKDLTDAQKEALKRNVRYNIEERVVDSKSDRDLMERKVDGALSRKRELEIGKLLEM